MDYQYELEQYDKEYKDLPLRERGARLPEGVYQVEVKEARVEQSGGDFDNLQLALVFEVISGEHEGTRHTKWTNLDNEVGRSITKEDLHTLAPETFDNAKLSDLPRLTGMLIEQRAEIRVKENHKDGKTYTNTYINKRLDLPGVDENKPF